MNSTQKNSTLTAVVHACYAACVSRTVSSPRPPTGLADGFGPEEPYGELGSMAAAPARRFTPGNCGSPAPRQLFEQSGTRRVAARCPAVGRLQRLSAMEVNRDRRCRGPKLGKILSWLVRPSHLAYCLRQRTRSPDHDARASLPGRGLAAYSQVTRRVIGLLAARDLRVICR